MTPPRIELADNKDTPGGTGAGPVPQELVDFFKRKGLKPSFSYKDVWAEEHQAAFTVAKILELDLLAKVKDTITKAIENGETLETWKKNITPTLQQSGWWGDTTEKTRPSRLRTIFETNMRVARAVGQEERAQRIKKDLPFFIYELGPSKEHNPEHVSWAGTILPVDHPWWDDHTPPCKYGCKCRKRQITQSEADRNGGESDPPEDKLVKWQQPNGKTVEVPAGVHPTFAYPKTLSGRSKALEASLSQAKKGQSGPTEQARSRPAEIARHLSDGARRVLRELVELCPHSTDTTGCSKFTGSDIKTARKYLDGELARSNLVAKRTSQERLPLYPTDLGRQVASLLIPT